MGWGGQALEVEDDAQRRRTAFLLNAEMMPSGATRCGNAFKMRRGFVQFIVRNLGKEMVNLDASMLCVILSSGGTSGRWMTDCPS